MEFNLADELDLEWHGIYQKHLKSFSFQNENHPYSFDDILQKVFCSDADVKNGDKDICEKCLMEALHFLLNRPTLPRQTQIRFLLNLARYVAKDESCFINLNSNNVLRSLIYLSQPSIDINTKFTFMEFLHAFLEHQTGVKWLIDTKYWGEVLRLTVHYRELNHKVSDIGYEILRILLEKAMDMDKIVCEEIIMLIAGPLLNTSQQMKLMIPENGQTLDDLKATIICLIEILERLLENYSFTVLQYIMNLKVGVASDAISENCNDMAMCLILDRITLLLSFFALAEIFDGIKSISQDPLVLSGFIRIINREVDKGSFSIIFKLYYYALKYLKHISDKLPTYFLNDERIDVEDQIVALQLKPILKEWARLDGATHTLKGYDGDLLPLSHPLKICKNLWLKTLDICFKITEKLPECSFEVYTEALENITRSKNLYSKKSLRHILESLVYCLEAPLKYLQSKENEEVTIDHAQQFYIEGLIRATKVFIESFNLDWVDSVKVLDLLYIVIESSCSYPWIEPITVSALNLLQQVISRRLSPSMALLIDTADGLQNIGPLLYKTCMANEWEVRNAVLEVVHTLALSINNSGFSSYKTILFDASLPSQILTMALNDDSSLTRATALKCLQQIIVMEDVEEILPVNTLINRSLLIIMNNKDPMVKKEAIRLIAAIYKHEEDLDQDVTMKIYRCLELVALSNSTDVSVQKEAIEFWRYVTKKFLINEGWMDRRFPAVTFSKRIVRLTPKEVNKRMYKVLNELSRIGCLSVFEKFWKSKENHPDLEKSLLEYLYRFHYNFREHKVTPESMLFNQKYLDLSTSENDSFVSPQEEDDVLQDIIDDMAKKMIPDDLELVNNEDVFTLMDTKDTNKNLPNTSAGSTSEITRRISPHDFVVLVYKQVAALSSKGDCPEESPFHDSDVYIIDY